VSAVVGPVTLTFDFLTLKRVHGQPGHGLPWCQIWASGAFQFSTYVEARDRQTDRQTDDGHQRLMLPPYGGRGIISNRRIGTQVVSAAELTFKRHSRSPAMSPFDTSHMNS